MPGTTQMKMVKVYEFDACTDTDVDDYGDPGFPDNNCMKPLSMEGCNENDIGEMYVNTMKIMKTIALLTMIT